MNDIALYAPGPCSKWYRYRWKFPVIFTLNYLYWTGWIPIDSALYLSVNFTGVCFTRLRHETISSVYHFMHEKTASSRQAFCISQKCVSMFLSPDKNCRSPLFCRVNTHQERPRERFLPSARNQILWCFFLISQKIPAGEYINRFYLRRTYTVSSRSRSIRIETYDTEEEMENPSWKT